MPVNALIAQGIQPIGRDLPQVGNMLQQRRMDEAQEVRRNELVGIEREQLGMQRDTFNRARALDQVKMLYAPIKQGNPQAIEAGIAALNGFSPVAPEAAAAFRQTPANLAAAIAHVAGIQEEAPKVPNSYEEFRLAQNDPAYAAHLEGSRPKPTSVNLSVNTAEDFYSSLAKDQASKFSALAEAAQAAPARIERADRVLALLKTTPYTGAGADYKLAFGKAAKTAGFDYGGDDIENTESLAAELAGATLDAIKTSGLGSGQGFTNKDREFLELASAGRINLDAGTLRRLAILNKKAGLATIRQYNERSKRLKKEQLDVMGMPQDIQPAGGWSVEEMP